MADSYRSRKQSGKRVGAKERPKVTRKEKGRVIQLLVSATLFMGMWLGKGMFPDAVAQVRHQVLDALHSDTDYRAVFALLGSQVDQGVMHDGSMGQLLVEVFSGQGSDDTSAPIPTEQIVVENFDKIEVKEEAMVELDVVEDTEELEPKDLTLFAPQHYTEYVGAVLPDNATMDWVPINVGETVTPVMAAYSSHYGWRLHPLLNEEKFHAGIDIAGNHGESIRAFANGVVEFIGEGPSYGLYLQIQHDDGVTSFYAHCSSVTATVGQQVSVGDKIAEVGDTGDVTGTHLHFELKRDGVLLNPYYYIQP